MGNIIQNIAGMADLTEQIVAADFLVASKGGIKMYAAALAETTNPAVREVLRKHLMVAIDNHERITNYMISKNYYHPFDIKKQIDMDIEAVNKVLNLQ